MELSREAYQDAMHQTEIIKESLAALNRVMNALPASPGGGGRRWITSAERQYVVDRLMAIQDASQDALQDLLSAV